MYTVDYKDYTKKVQFVLEYQKYDDGAHFKYCEPVTLLFPSFFSNSALFLTKIQFTVWRHSNGYIVVPRKPRARFFLVNGLKTTRQGVEV